LKDKQTVGHENRCGTPIRALASAPRSSDGTSAARLTVSVAVTK
jgi:hypothetical protein